MSNSQAAVVDEPEVYEKPKASKPKPKRQPRYHVILWDDSEHTFEYVIRMMTTIFRYTPERGYELAKEVDTSGRAICLTTTREHAELKRDQVLAFGKDPLSAKSKSSMIASIEPAE